MKDMRPNLVFINVDQMRADCLGAEGHPVVETPNLDQLAREGVRCTQAYSAVPSCIAARAALLTGLQPKSHGRVGYQDGVPWNYEVTLPGELARAGYQTQAIGKMHVHPARSLLGFHNVILHDGYLHFNRRWQKAYEQYDDYTVWLRRNFGFDADFTATGLNCNSWCARPWHLPEESHPTSWVGSESVDFLRRRDPRKPFFLWMSFVRPHAPLDPPQAYFDLYKDRVMPGSIIGDWAQADDPERNGWIVDCHTGIVRGEALGRARAAYYALITHIDAQVQRLRQVLGEYELLENTVFIFASDHGEMLGDHNLFRKCLPYDASARVPLIVTLPRRFGLPAGSTVDAPVELRDIMPTFLEAAGVPIPAGVEGQSLLPLMRGQSPAWRGYLHGEHPAGVRSNHWITDGKMMYAWFSQAGHEQLFDLAHDPRNCRDLASLPAYREQRDQFRRLLIRELEGREEGYSDGRQLIVGRPPQSILSHLRAEQDG